MQYLPYPVKRLSPLGFVKGGEGFFYQFVKVVTVIHSISPRIPGMIFTTYAQTCHRGCTTAMVHEQIKLAFLSHLPCSTAFHGGNLHLHTDLLQFGLNEYGDHIGIRLT